MENTRAFNYQLRLEFSEDTYIGSWNNPVKTKTK